MDHSELKKCIGPQSRRQFIKIGTAGQPPLHKSARKKPRQTDP